MYHFSISRIDGDLRETLSTVVSGSQLFNHSRNSVFIKPNFTYPFFKRGVTTTRELIIAVVELLKDIGFERICIGEGEGGYNSFSMEETFRNFRLSELAKRYGVEIVNVMNWPSYKFETVARRTKFEVNIPRPLLEEFDSFVTLPVPKVHAMTTVSSAIKNQWGLVQDGMRLRLHCAFDQIINKINSLLPNPVAIIDGTYGLTRNGPMIEGIEVELGWLAACDNVWLSDRTVCELMRIPLGQVSHLSYADKLGLMPKMSECRLPDDFKGFVDDRFYLKKNLWNRLAKFTWYSPRLNHIVYFSKCSGLLHRLMYSLREKPKELHSKGIEW